MRMKIDPDSFVAHGKNSLGYVVGIVNVSIAGELQSVNAYISEYSNSKTINLFGFVGQYMTSNKDWPAYVQYKIGDEIDNFYVYFGRDDNSGRFNKQDAIRYDYASYSKLTEKSKMGKIVDFS